MSSILTHTRKDVLTLNTKDFQSQSNNWDKSLPHRYGTTLIVNGENGYKIEIEMGTLLALISIFDQLQKDDNPGPTLDKLFEFLRTSRGQSSVEEALRSIGA